MNNPEYRQIVLTVEQAWLVLFCTTPLLAMAFSVAVRKLIGARDRWTCQDTGKKFSEGWMLHASHYNHDKSKPDYDSVDNGRMQSVSAHLQYHEDHVGKAEKIGLSERDNNYAIQKLREADERTQEYRRGRKRN